MNFSGPLYKGVWIKRYKRFLVDVRLDSGETVTAHCPNTGSMMGCWREGAPVMLSHHPGKGRKLEYSLEIVKPGRCWVGVNTMMTNRIAEEAIKKKQITELSEYDFERRETPHGNSRFDFSLTKGKKRLYLEVKNVSLVEKGVAMFPDAKTERGAKHLEELAGICEKGGHGAVLFLVQRADAASFAPAEHIDPVFAEVLRSAVKKGVIPLSYRCSITSKNIVLDKPLKVTL